MSGLETIIGDVHFYKCFWNASGALCQSLKELNELYEIETTGAVVTKTCTLREREGNKGKRWYCEGSSGKTDFSVNSMGLPNLGIDCYLEWIQSKKISERKKPIFLSVGGLSFGEYKKILFKIYSSKVPIDFIELNLSCPNLKGKGMVAYDYKSLEKYLIMLTQSVKKMSTFHKVCCGIKLPPYFDQQQFLKISEILNRFAEHGLTYVTCINGIPNALVIDWKTEKTAIHPNGGCGGMGGRVTKAVGLANVYRFRSLLHPSIAIIGCGGVTSGRDVFEYILAGAQAVEIATQLVVEGKECFSRIEGELLDILKRKGYSSIQEAKNKLRVLE